MRFHVTFADDNQVCFNDAVSGKALSALYPPELPAVAMRVNHYLRPLSWMLDDDCTVSWVDTTSFEGVTVYRNTLSFLLVVASRRVLQRDITVRHSISDALYWEFVDKERATEEDVAAIEMEMRRLIEADIPIQREVLSLDRVRRLLEAQHKGDTAHLLALAAADPVELYRCGDLYGCFYGPLLPSAGGLKQFVLSLLAPGLALRYPTVASSNEVSPFSPLPKVARVFGEYARWLSTMGVATMADLYQIINDGESAALVLMAEALHAQRFTELAEEILQDRRRRMVTIAGPSASGKTTSAEKLRIQLRIAGITPSRLSLDDYYLPKAETPLDEFGEPDFESVDALDLEQLKADLIGIVAGEAVEVPVFDFRKRCRTGTRTIQLGDGDVVIVEGLHGLHDRIVSMVAPEQRFGIFVSPLTGVSLDRHNRTSTTDNRLLRRLVRDLFTRGYSAEDTLKQWPSVIRGGNRYIFPYQQNADAMFNTSLLYELPVLKNHAEPLLRRIGETSPAYGEAQRLLGLLRYVPSLSSDLVPNNSVLREFIGGSIVAI